jgi:hypothetical protein
MWLLQPLLQKFHKRAPRVGCVAARIPCGGYVPDKGVALVGVAADVERHPCRCQLRLREWGKAGAFVTLLQLCTTLLLRSLGVIARLLLR